MTACCCRLAQPANSRQKNASGGGNGSMAKACPRRYAGSRTMRIGPNVRTHTSSSGFVDPPVVGCSGLGVVFAQDAVTDHYAYLQFARDRRAWERVQP